MKTDPVSERAYRESLGTSWQRGAAAGGKMTPREWASTIYRLKGGGRFSWDYAPHAGEMFDSIFDRRNIQTVMQVFSRGLKSTCVRLAIGFIIDQDPESILAMWPTKDDGEKWSKGELTQELFDTTDCLRFLGSGGKKRTGANTLLHKLFPGGMLDIVGSNAAGALRRAKASVLLCDEIDAMHGFAGDEGDIIKIAMVRVEEFPFPKKVFCSYPSITGKSRINSMLAETDYRQWQVTCPKCGGEPFTMQRSQLVYQPGQPETARLICPRCNAELDDRDRDRMYRAGKWVPTREYRGKRGFQANSLLWPHPIDPAKYPGGYLQILAQKEIDAAAAEKPRDALRVLVNTVDAEPFDPAEENEKPPEWKILFDRREDYVAAPLDARIATAFVDVQRNRLEIEWRVWAENQESWGIRHVVLDGDTLRPEIWEGPMVRELERGVERIDGAHMALSRAHIDAGWAGDMVKYFLDWIRDHQRPIYGKVRASKGDGPGPIIAGKWSTVTKNLKGWRIGTWSAKEWVNNRLRMEVPGLGYMHYCKAYDEEFFRQLCTGVLTTVYDKGVEVRKFLNKDKFRDEALDLAVGNLASFRSRRWQFAAAEAELLASIPAKVPVPVAPPAAAPARRRAGVTW